MSTCACKTSITLYLYKGRDRTIRISIDGLGDITGFKVWFSVKSTRDPEATALIDKRTFNNGGSDNQILITDGPNGILEVYIDPVDTTDLEYKDYWWDLVVGSTPPEKIRQIVDPSIFKLLKPVTDAT